MKKLSFNFTLPLSTFFGSLTKESNFVDDAKLLVSLSPEEFAAILDSLSRPGDFVAPRDVLQRFASVDLVEQSVAEKIARITARLCQLLQDQGASRDDALNELRLVALNFDAIDSKDREEFSRRITALVGAPAIEMQRKAESLAKQGVLVEGVDIICDMRPVFDRQHCDVVGIVPLVTMFLDIEGTAKPQIVLLSEHMLMNLQEKVNRACSKLAIVKELSSRMNVSVPNTSRTE